nr:alpha/beta fold hydrolase [Kineosporia rhizophila]
MAYAPEMTDPTLAGRLARVTAPTLVLWGEADQIANPNYGRVFAAAIPGARFALITEAGHLPQIERPRELIESIWSFLEEVGD